MSIDCWLPSLFPCPDLAQWETYEEQVYQIFKHDFIDTRPVFSGRPVKIRKHPLEYDREDSFWHITSNHYTGTEDRAPDLRRCERIRWVRSFIENYNCCSSECPKCDGVKVWEEPYRSKLRTNILLEEECYLVVIEKRDSYFLLITAYYIEHNHNLEKKVKNYERYRNA